MSSPLSVGSWPQNCHSGVSMHVTGILPNDEDEEEVILTRQQNNERFLKKTRSKQSQVSKLTEQLEDLKWQLFYGNSEKDKEVKLMRQALLLKEQELADLRSLQLSALSQSNGFSNSSSSSSDSSPSSSSSSSSSSPASFSSSSSSCSVSSSSPRSNVSQLYGAIVQVLQHQGLIMRHLAAANSSTPPLDSPHPAVSDRLDVIERDVHAHVSIALGDQLGSTASLLSLGDSLLLLHRKIESLIAMQQAEALRKQQKCLQREHDKQLLADGWLTKKSARFSLKIFVLSAGVVACGLYYMFISPRRSSKQT